VTRDNWLYVQQFVSEETIVVDLDRNNVMFGEKTPVLPPLPGKKWKKLRNSLEEGAGHLFWRTRGLESEYRESRGRRLDLRRFKEAARQKGEIRWNEKLVTFDQAFDLQFTPDSENILTDLGVETEQNQWDRVQESFLRFFVALLKDYRRFLVTPDGDSPSSPGPSSGDWMQWDKRKSFDRDGFLQSQKGEYVAYLSDLTMTQQFDDFITKRLYSPEMPDIIFFDQSIDAKLNRSRLKLRKVDTPFLQSVKAHKVLQKFVAVEPFAVDVNVKTPFVYKHWPEKFNPRLFGVPRPIPTIITAEFDRQAAVISRLRSSHPSVPVDSKQLVDFDNDTSPEGMAFTVFFYAYSAVIGREWQAFQQKQRELQVIASVDIGSGELVADKGVGLDPETQIETVEVKIADFDNALSDTYLGLCDGCPNGSTKINDAVIYVTTSPCPRQIDDFNAQAQIALEAISELANSPFAALKGRTSSLLDNDNDFAEYEEAHYVAVAQLDLAFDTLKTMETRGLLCDPDVFKSLMEACGRCGDTKRALELIETMKRDGLAADQEVLSCLMTAFAHNDDDLVDDPSNEEVGVRRRSSDHHSAFLKKNLESMNKDTTKGTLPTEPMSDSEGDSDPSDYASDNSSEILASPIGAKISVGSAILDWFYPSETINSKKARRRRRRRRRRSSMMASRGQPINDRLSTQIMVGESLLDFLYPDLKIDTEGDSCPQCSNSMTRSDVIAGWQRHAFQNVTTCCPQCQHRFVPRFSVSCSAPTFEGSQGVGTPLYCELLSPWVLRKELSHVIGGEKGIDLILDPQWRGGTQVGATIWWNLITMFKYYKLPFSFLLQGSFQNRLINPVPQDQN
jgi:pentatricopeptide repeat protein